MAKYKNTIYQTILPMVVALSLSVGILLGFFISEKEASNDDISNATIKYGEILRHLEKRYVDSVNIKQLSEHSIKRMLETLDPHTIYIPASEQLMAQAQLEKDFEGIGIEFTILKDTLFILNTIVDGPSERALALTDNTTNGLRRGDKVIAVNDELIAGVQITNNDIFKKLKGKEGSAVKVKVKRRGVEPLLDFKIIRDKIRTNSVDVSYMINDETGFIKFNRFSRNTKDNFKNALVALQRQGLKNLIIDLRDNGGGYLDEAKEIAEEFLDRDDLIVYTKGKIKSENKEYVSERKGIFEGSPLIVLIDEGSASASEIVAGALQDNDRGLIVGRRSFGKGLVQLPIELVDGSVIRLTTSRYYTPSGRCIQKPYEPDDGSYQDEYLKQRFENGELFSADSIKFVDTLKYKTKSGRVVYGGGGIMPDIFIPRDTSDYSNYFANLFSSLTLLEFGVYYEIDHHKKIQQMGEKRFVKNFAVSDKVLDYVVFLGEGNGIKFRPKEFKKSKELIKHWLKAYIARYAFGEQAFYKVLHQRDDFVKKAVNSFDIAKKLSMAAKM